ncbi:helix-turn-helix domain-containing protein [Bradyrhizobium sp. UFLA05-109]
MIVQKLRLQRGWSQEELAELSGLSVRTIQRIERGNAASMESLKALGAVFEIDFSTLKETDMDMTAGEQTMKPDEVLAFNRVRKIKGFYLHVTQYCIVVGVLAVFNIMTYPRYLWVLWVAFGWGTAVLIHGLRTFDKVPFMTGEWERREVERYLGRKL